MSLIDFRLSKLHHYITMLTFYFLIAIRIKDIIELFYKNYGSRSKKGETLRFELSHNALNRKPQK